MLAAIDIHKAVFQTAVLDPDDGEVLAEERLKASREELVAWIEKWDGKLDVVAIEATTGWRWVTRELQARGIEVRLTDPGQASALQGNRKRPKTDRLDARWLVMLLARELLPDAWAPPEDIVPARQDPTTQIADRRPHPLGAAPARTARPRGLAMFARVVVNDQRSALGRRDLPASQRPRPDQRHARRDGDTRARD